MADIQKPDMTKQWASSGDKTPPSDALLASGWNSGDIPSNTDFNYIDARQDQGLAYLLQKGVPEWDSGTEYQANKSYVQYGGKIYKCIQTGTNKQPDTQLSYWRDEQGVSPSRTIISFDGTGVADGSLINFAGRDTVGDGGGGYLRFLAGSTATADGVTIYAVTGGRLVREGWSVFGINVLWAGADPDGLEDSEPAFSLAIACAATIKAKVYAPAGTYLIGGSKYVNVLAGVELFGEGFGTRLVSAEGGKTANHVFVYLKDGATVRDLRLSGSPYIKQSGGADYICFNKIGISTQGATANARATVLRVGFERFTNSHVYAHSETNGMEVRGCYTFGDQVAQYAETDTTGLVTNWNATADSVKLTAGTQVYSLTNFFNNASGTKDVTLADNKVKNICDSFVGHNSGASNIKVYGNTCIKDTDGYYGGYGIDANGGSDLKGWGNSFQGHSYGAYIHAGATGCRVFGNDLRGPHGVVFEDATSINNTATDNDITLMEVGSLGRGSGVTSFGASNNVFGENRIVGGSSTAATLAVTGATNNGAGLIRLTVVAHGRKRREIVKVTGVTGTTEANGVWEIVPVDADRIDLLRSVFANAYVSGGSAQFGARGVTVTKLGASNSSGNRCDNGKIRDVVTGFLSPDANNTVEEFRTRFEGSIGTQFDGAGILRGRLTNVSGISSGVLPCNNLTGGVLVSDTATTGVVTFSSAEPDTNYRVQLTVSTRTGTPASGAYTPVEITSKTVNGFTVNVLAAPGSGNSVGFNWAIFR